MNLDPIGTVVNGVTEPGDAGWGGVVSEIRLLPELARGTLGLDGFSHAVIIFLMHHAAYAAEAHLTRHPRDRADMPLVGIFAQRARHRPNPIGVSTVRIERVSGASIHVRGLDAIDGTPVLDVKPHVQAFDSPAQSTEPEWVKRLMLDYF